MVDSRTLLPHFLHVYPFQPATGIWRSVEIAALLNHGLPEGLGLDVGCGDGLLTGIIDSRLKGNRAWIGIDPDEEEIALALQTGLYDKCISTPGSTLPLDSDSFDFAISNSVLEHIPNLQPVLSEISRVLKPQGHFIFTVPSNTFHSALRGPLLPFTGRQKYLGVVDKRCAHIHYKNENEWQTLLAEAGMSIASAIPYLNQAETQLWESCSRYTGGILYALFAHSRQPIQIQRQLGIRRSGMRMPLPLARLIARILQASLDGENRGAPFGCLLIDAVKN